MKQPSLLVRATPWLWGIVVLILVVLFLMANWQISWVAFFGLLALLSGLGIVTLLLTIRYRQAFVHWWVWVSMLGISILGLLVSQRLISVPHTGVTLLATLTFLFGSFALLVALCIQFYLRDIGVQVVGWFSVICVWAMIVWWAMLDNPIEILLNALVQPDQPNPILWIGMLFSTAACIIPLALLSFLWHTAVLINREIRGGP